MKYGKSQGQFSNPTQKLPHSKEQSLTPRKACPVYQFSEENK
jgi:hypothetical protein